MLLPLLRIVPNVQFSELSVMVQHQGSTHHFWLHDDTLTACMFADCLIKTLRKMRNINFLLPSVVRRCWPQVTSHRSSIGGTDHHHLPLVH